MILSESPAFIGTFNGTPNMPSSSTAGPIPHDRRNSAPTSPVGKADSLIGRPTLPSFTEHPRLLQILIADDNPISSKILEVMLKKMACQCVVVKNGAEAIRCAMGDIKFDLIIMDIHMPISNTLQFFIHADATSRC